MKTKSIQPELGIWPELAEVTEVNLYALTLVREMAMSEARMVSSSQPEIIDHHTAEGKVRFQQLLAQCKNGEATFNPTPYSAAYEELLELGQAMVAVPNSQAEIVEQISAALLEKSPGVLIEDIVSLVQANSLPQDLLSLSRDARRLGGTAQLIENDSRWIWFPETKELLKMIGPEAYFLLVVKSRQLGLIPFSAIEQLQKLKIRCAGASAVVNLLELLACLGAQDVRWWDAGMSAPSNLGRLGKVGDVRLLGGGKASSLQTTLHHFNPYASYVGTQGKVVQELDPESKTQDISYKDFISDADLVIEVVDNAASKIALRFYIRDNKKEVKVVYLADVSKAFVRLEETTIGNHFGQGIPEQFFTDLLKDFQALNELPESPEKSERLGKLNLHAVVHMLLKNFPPEHQMQFLYIATGLIPFWSQTSISARESAATGARLILQMLLNLDVVNKTQTSDTISQSLVPNYTPQQLQTLGEVMVGTFGIKKGIYS